MDLSQTQGESPTIKLRDKRKPGHCWQDNELYDCFQPVIGALAVSVYVRITRECYGTALRIGLRELAALTGISKSAVARALAVLEGVGLVRAKRGAVKQAAELDLTDLKELAVRHGAVFDHGRCSYVLPAEVRRKLRQEVADLRRRMHGSSVPLGDSDGNSVEDGSVPLMSESVPLEGRHCPPNEEKMGVQQNSKKSRTRNKSNTPLPPSQASGECVNESEERDAGNHRSAAGDELGGTARASDAAGVLPGVSSGPFARERGLQEIHAADGAGVGAAAERVMRVCGWVNRRLKPMIAEAIVLAAERGDAEGHAADRMIAMWRDLQRASDRGLLCYAISPRKFVAEAHWRTDAMWPYDRGKLAEMRQASVGARG